MVDRPGDETARIMWGEPPVVLGRVMALVLNDIIVKPGSGLPGGGRLIIPNVTAFRQSLVGAGYGEIRFGSRRTFNMAHTMLDWSIVEAGETLEVPFIHNGVKTAIGVFQSYSLIPGDLAQEDGTLKGPVRPHGP